MENFKLNNNNVTINEKALAGLISVLIGEDIDLADFCSEEKHDLGKITPVQMKADDPRIILSPEAEKAKAEFKSFDPYEDMKQSFHQCFNDLQKAKNRIEELEAQVAELKEDKEALMDIMESIRYNVRDYEDMEW